MEDKEIVELYWQRKEDAIPQTAKKYGSYCRTIAYNILADEQDTEECVNDTWLGAWNSMPDNRPSRLAPYLAKLTRRISLDAYRKRAAQKRGQGETALALEELKDCLMDDKTTENQAEGAWLSDSIQQFLSGLPEAERRVFLLRYWHLYSVEETARRMGYSQSKTASQLFRTRMKLKNHLMKEGFL